MQMPAVCLHDLRRLQPLFIHLQTHGIKHLKLTKTSLQNKEHGCLRRRNLSDGMLEGFGIALQDGVDCVIGRDGTGVADNLVDMLLVNRVNGFTKSQVNAK